MVNDKFFNENGYYRYELWARFPSWKNGDDVNGNQSRTSTWCVTSVRNGLAPKHSKRWRPIWRSMLVHCTISSSFCYGWLEQFKGESAQHFRRDRYKRYDAFHNFLVVVIVIPTVVWWLSVRSNRRRNTPKRCHHHHHHLPIPWLVSFHHAKLICFYGFFDDVRMDITACFKRWVMVIHWNYNDWLMMMMMILTTAIKVGVMTTTTTSS